MQINDISFVKNNVTSELFDHKLYIYIVIHSQICFVLSELINVARQYHPVAGIETRLTQTRSQRF